MEDKKLHNLFAQYYKFYKREAKIIIISNLALLIIIFYKLVNV